MTAIPHWRMGREPRTSFPYVIDRATADIYGSLYLSKETYNQTLDAYFKDDPDWIEGESLIEIHDAFHVRHRLHVGYHFEYGSYTRFDQIQIVHRVHWTGEGENPYPLRASYVDNLIFLYLMNLLEVMKQLLMK